MASVAPVKFRCFQCQKLLGVSRSKIGTVVACPQCAAELIVPEPAEMIPPSPSASSSGINQAPASAPPPAKPVSASRVEPGVVPWDAAPEPEHPFPVIQTEPLSLRPDPPAFFKTNARPASDEKLKAVSTLRDEPIVDVASVAFAPEPTSIREESASRAVPALVREGSPRRSDVVLPRTAVLLWSMLVLLALVFAFGTGLLAGRFLWAPGVRVGSPEGKAAAPAR